MARSCSAAWGRSVRLTPAGEVLFEYAKRFLTLRQESLRAVADQSATPRGMITIGANEATCLYVLPDVFGKYQQLYPDVQISIYRNFSHKILQRVEDGTHRPGHRHPAGEIAQLEGAFDLSRSRGADGQPEKSAGQAEDRDRQGYCQPAADFSQDRIHAAGAGQIFPPLRRRICASPWNCPASR